MTKVVIYFSVKKLKMYNATGGGNWLTIRMIKVEKIVLQLNFYS